MISTTLCKIFKFWQKMMCTSVFVTNNVIGTAHWRVFRYLANQMFEGILHTFSLYHDILYIIYFFVCSSCMVFLIVMISSCDLRWYFPLRGRVKQWYLLFIDLVLEQKSISHTYFHIGDPMLSNPREEASLEAMVSSKLMLKCKFKLLTGSSK